MDQSSEDTDDLALLQCKCFRSMVKDSKSRWLPLWNQVLFEHEKQIDWAKEVDGAESHLLFSLLMIRK